MFKLPGKNTLRMYGKTMGLYGSLIGIGLFIFLWLRVSRLSRLKDLGESRFEELNRELRRLPIVEESRDSWTRPRVKETIILSAYLDTRPEVVLEEDSSLMRRDYAWAMIRIIGIIPVRMEKSRLTCHYRYEKNGAENKRNYYTLRRESIGTRLAAFQENFGMAYCAAYILCEFPGRHDDDDENGDIYLPREVTITSDANIDQYELNDDEFVVVRYPKNGWKNATTDNKSVAICVQPIHHRFDRALDLVAFVEFYRMMGIDRFTFYRDSVGPRVNRILDHYAQQGIATLIEWRLADFYLYERNLRVDGIFAALNDCLYRSAFHDSYRYVAGVDIDEYIVPREHENIKLMMEYLDPNGDDLTAGWIFRNIFFYLMHEDDSSTLPPGTPRLKLHAKTMRWRETNRPGDRSKYIVRARDVIDLGNHHVWKFKRAWSVFGKRLTVSNGLVKQMPNATCPARRPRRAFTFPLPHQIDVKNLLNRKPSYLRMHLLYNPSKIRANLEFNNFLDDRKSVKLLRKRVEYCLEICFSILLLSILSNSRLFMIPGRKLLSGNPT